MKSRCGENGVAAAATVSGVAGYLVIRLIVSACQLANGQPWHVKPVIRQAMTLP